MPSVMLGLACPSRLLTTCTGTPACGPEGVLALARQHRRQGLRAAEAPRTCGVREPMDAVRQSAAKTVRAYAQARAVPIDRRWLPTVVCCTARARHTWAARRPRLVCMANGNATT